jgi:hypothetical protein
MSNLKFLSAMYDKQSATKERERGSERKKEEFNTFDLK